VTKLLFIPVSLLGGLAAGALSRKLFDQIWGLIDADEPPESKHRDVPWGKLIAAAILQGAIFRGVKAATDHFSRVAFARTTGTWPGKERPEPE
jgi:Protein of unknown function (DUF4235)